MVCKKTQRFSAALITGASSGIGEALARRLAGECDQLIVAGRNPDRLFRVAQAVNADAIVADLNRDPERKALIRLIREKSPELLINCAGFGMYGPVTEHSIEEQMEILHVNAVAVTELLLEAVQALVRAGKEGVVLNVSSAAGFFLMPEAALYAATKAYLTSLSQSLDLELASKGIRVLVSCPGMVATRFRERASKRVSHHPQKGVMTAQYAAAKIWKQIQNRKRLKIFSLRYRVALFFSHFLPTQCLGKRIRANLHARRFPR